MTISITYTNPPISAVGVLKTIGKNSNPISVIIDNSSGSFNPASFQVSINSVPIIINGASQTGRYLSLVQPVSSTSREIQIIFSNPSDSFDDYENVFLYIEARDSLNPAILLKQTIFFRIQDTISPILDNFAPLNLSTNNPINTPIFIKIRDSGSGVNLNSVNVSLNIEVEGIAQSYDAILQGIFQSGFRGSLTNADQTLEILISSDTNYPSDANIQITAYVEDNEQNSLPIDFNFQIVDVKPPRFAALAPSANQLNVSQNTTIALNVTDLFGSGLELSSLNMSVNNFEAIIEGVLQPEIIDLAYSQIIVTYFTSRPDIESISILLKLKNSLPSSSRVKINASIKDNKNNLGLINYYFTTKDYQAPWIENNSPQDQDKNVLPSTPIQFEIVDDYDGYATDFSFINIVVDGYSVLNQTFNNIPVEGYFDGYIGQVFSAPSFNQQIEYTIPSIDGYDGYTNFIIYPGFKTTIIKKDFDRFIFQINCLKQFNFNKEIYYQIDVSDRGGNMSTYFYYFYTADQDTLTTIAIPSSGTYKNYIDGYDGYYSTEAFRFLYETGVILQTNLENTTTFYTTDGTNPRITSQMQVVGNTKVYSKPILLNKEGLNVIKFFSIDSAGNKEDLKQEFYMINPLPAQANFVSFIKITSDIPYPTSIIPVESTVSFKIDQFITILDDKRPPISTKIIAINKTSDPQYIIIQDAVDKLKVSRNARIKIVETLLDPAASIHLDTTQLNNYMYIGSDLNGINNADSIFEQFRILNRASTDEEILADYTLLAKGVKFSNQTTSPSFSNNLSPLEKSRANLPDSTLVLLDFDGSVQASARLSQLINSTVQIVDIKTASNDLIFTIKISDTENVDRDLLTNILKNFAPIDLNVIVKYQNI